MNEGTKMSDHIPEKAREAIREELAGDHAKYRDEVAEGEWTKPNRGPSPLLTLRVSPSMLEELQALATELGMPVSTLARELISEGIANRSGEDLRAMLERLERDLAALKARALAS